MSSATAPTANPAVTARTRTSAPGSEPRAGGFTLVELLVVLVLIALASGVAGLALRQSDESRLEREAVRLAALLEAGRAEARASGLAVRFELNGAGTSPTTGAPDPANRVPGDDFRFVGLLPSQRPPGHWLDPATTARIEGGKPVRLGPEPMIGRQRIVLSLGDREVVLATDGLSPFALLPLEGSPP